MARLTIRLLGPVQIVLGGKSVTGFDSEKARALLVYLAAEAGRPHRREVLAEMLWPDRPEGAARTNLRHALAQMGGSAVPTWGGAQAGQPGNAYAKVLRDLAMGEAPVVSYWKQAQIVSDNRIAALASDASMYTFAVPGTGGTVTVTAELCFRRVYQEVADARGWDMPDIVMEEQETTLAAAPWWAAYLPLVMADDER
jgi:hypothetical protein